MHRTFWLALSVAAALSTVALADDWSKTFQISGRPELRVNTNDGSVTVRTWDRKEIEARVTTVHWRIPSDVQVIEHGQIAEQGTHTELIASGGYYADLYQKQLLEEELEAI